MHCRKNIGTGNQNTNTKILETAKIKPFCQKVVPLLCIVCHFSERVKKTDEKSTEKSMLFNLLIFWGDLRFRG